MTRVLHPNPDVLQFHNELIVADMHADTWLMESLFGYDVRKRHRSYIPRNPLFNHIDVPRAKEGGLDITGQGVVAYPFHRSGCFNRAIKMINRIRKGITRNSGSLELALSATKAVDTVKRGKIAVFIGVEGAHCLSGRIDALEDFYAKGARYLTLGHFSRNEAVFSSNDVRNHNQNLTPWGKELVLEIERLGMMTDLAHVAPGCFWDVVKLLKKPAIVSHIGMKALRDHWRNLDDDQLRAIADGGGVVGVMFQPSFLSKNNFYCLLDIVINHIEHCMNIAGEDHVALGSDFDGFITTPEGLEDVTGLPNITQRLLDRGHSKETVKKILGENFLRVFKAVCG